MTSTKIKNADRNEFICAVLDDKFTTRFIDLQDRLAGWVKTRVAELHPTFVKLRASKEARIYVSTSNGLSILVDRDGEDTCYIPLRKPRGLIHSCKFGLEALYARYHNPDRDSFVELQAPIDYPSHQGVSREILLETSHPLVVEYDALWAELFQAKEVIHTLIWSYTQREKFEADFPQLAPYLPARVSVVRALVVPVAEFAAKLNAIGIPPTVEA